MATPRAAVFTARPTPFIMNRVPGNWSPISCTLVYDETRALLVDTAITYSQNEELVAWILKIAPGRKLDYVYITHGHPDHWVGLPIVLKRFPEAKVLATSGTVAHMRHDARPKFFSRTWGAWFGEQIPQPFVFPEPLTGSRFSVGPDWSCEVIEVGHTDTSDTTVLWIPKLKLVIAGDVVYGQVHQMLAEANTAKLRAEWLKALDIVESLNPTLVVGGHQQPEEVHGPWSIAATRRYIEDFGRLSEEVRARNGSAEDLYNDMMKIYGDRANPMVLRWGCDAQFPRAGRSSNNAKRAAL